MAEKVSSRRKFLKVVAASTAAAWVLPACGSSGSNNSQTSAPLGDVSAGRVSDIALGSLQVVDSQPLALGRDSGGLYAMTLICTHAQCDMSTQGSVSAAGVSCSCHGSRFDVNGAVTRGPATAPLAHFAVVVDAAGDITVQGENKVPAETRTAVA